jgi:hypothetical protein
MAQIHRERRVKAMLVSCAKILLNVIVGTFLAAVILVSILAYNKVESSKWHVNANL